MLLVKFTPDLLSAVSRANSRGAIKLLVLSEIEPIFLFIK